MLLYQIQYKYYTHPIMPKVVTWLSACNEEVMMFEAHLQTHPLHEDEEQSTTIEEIPLNTLQKK